MPSNAGTNLGTVAGANSRNGAFDRMRGIGALCVVLIHAPPFLHSSIAELKGFGWILRLLCQAAVPYFFLLSGLMLGSKWAGGRRDPGEPLRMSRRIATLYLPWFAVFLAMDSWLARSNDAWSVVRRLVGFSDGRIETLGYHLWFLPCLLLAQIAVWTSLRRFGGALPALLSGVALFLGLDALDLAGIALPFGLIPTEGPNLSLACVALGAFLSSEHPGWRPSGRVVLAAFAGIVVESVAVAFLSGDAWPVKTFLLTRVAAPALLLAWLAKRPDFLGGGRTGIFLDSIGKHSTGIYVSHLLFLELIPFESMVSSGFVRENFVKWPVVLLGAWGFAWLLSRSRWPLVRSLVT